MIWLPWGRAPRRPRHSGLRWSLARETERLGYSRYWVAEHHNMPGIASSSPPVLLAHADELMVTTMTHGPAERLRSYRLVAEAAGLVPAGEDAGPTSLLEDRAVG